MISRLFYFLCHFVLRLIRADESTYKQDLLLKTVRLNGNRLMDGFPMRLAASFGKMINIDQLLMVREFETILRINLESPVIVAD